EVRPLRRVLTGVVDETIPYIDVDDAGLLGALPVKLVEISRVGRRTRVALRRQPDPEHRDASALPRRDGGVDPPDLGHFPLLPVKLERASAGIAATGGVGRGGGVA